jgi:hypothetical protein
MSLDRRLRSDLSDAASPYAPDVEAVLGSVTARGRRSRARRRVAGATLAGVAIAVGLVVVRPGSPADEVQSAATTVPAGAIEGRYVAMLTPEALGDDPGLSGGWTMELGADGSIALTPPGEPDAGTYVYSLDRDVLRTNAFVDERCAGLPNGSYRWRLVGDQLTLVRTSDACAVRVAVLASATWRRDP